MDGGPLAPLPLQQSGAADRITALPFRPANPSARNLESSAGGAGAASAPPAQANPPAPDMSLARTCAHDTAANGRRAAQTRRNDGSEAIGSG